MDASGVLYTTRKMTRLITLPLGALFLLSAVLNLGARIPLGFTLLSFSSPSSSIAGLEAAIGLALLVAARLSSLYAYGGAYLLAAVGTSEGLLSSDVQGLARNLHEAMVPFLVLGWILLIVDARAAHEAVGHRTAGQRTRQIVIVLQFFVGGLVTLGGVAYAKSGTYPVGTAVGLIHLAVGLTGLLAGYAYVRRTSRSREFLVGINVVTIVYSALAESLAEVYALLPPGVNDALIGTIIAIMVSAVIVYRLSSESGPVST